MKYVLPTKEINRLHRLGYGYEHGAKNCPRCKDRNPMCEVVVNGTRIIQHEADLEKPKSGDSKGAG